MECFKERELDVMKYVGRRKGGEIKGTYGGGMMM